MARLENPQYRAALEVVKVLHGHGSKAYFAGGCVRDLLLGVEPKDYDVTTAALPDQVLQWFPRTEAVGAHFGVVLVLDETAGERTATEVATFRTDGSYSDGRRPDRVQFSQDPQEDVLRRDFTVNGLLLDLERFEAGEKTEDCVLDFVDGRADLHAGVVRAIGDPLRRFAEDKLRMLRAVRFAARLGFTIEPQTMRAMQAIAGEVVAVSPERIREELTKILTEGAPRRGFELLDESGLLQVVLPEVARMKGCEQPPEYHPEGDVWVHTLMLLDHLQAGVSATLAWGMLLHDVGKPPTYTPPDPAKAHDRIRFNGHAEIGVAVSRAILNRLKFSNDDCAQILALVKHHMQFGDVPKMKQSTLKRFLRLPQFQEHMALHYADVMSSHKMLGPYQTAQKALQDMGTEEIRPELLITGSDLIRSGYKPGPKFREMLTAAEDAQLEGAVQSREEALSFVQAQFGAPPA
ncbi:MAG: CCA tRNA nucleotidyltransferase [Terriglobus roseus]|nr:CCA tRNA nucleotidyltransferase [Terriglobus roseus]